MDGKLSLTRSQLTRRRAHSLVRPCESTHNATFPLPTLPPPPCPILRQQRPHGRTARALSRAAAAFAAVGRCRREEGGKRDGGGGALNNTVCLSNNDSANAPCSLCSLHPLIAGRLAPGAAKAAAAWLNARAMRPCGRCWRARREAGRGGENRGEGLVPCRVCRPCRAVLADTAAARSAVSSSGEQFLLYGASPPPPVWHGHSRLLRRRGDSAQRAVRPTLLAVTTRSAGRGASEGPSSCSCSSFFASSAAAPRL